MARLPKVIDLEDAPDLPRLVDEVRQTHGDVVIRQGGENVAVLSPAGTHKSHGPKRVITEADIEAFRESAGSWKGRIDRDAFLAEIYERRKHWTRPPVKL